MKTKFRLRHLALDSICRNLSRRAASLTDLASKVARHAFEVQPFARNRAVVFDDRSGKLMSEVGATVADLLVFTRQRATRLGPIRAALLFAGKPPLSAFDLAFSFSEESRVFNDAAIGVGGETIKAYVDTDCRFRLNCRFGQIGKVKFGDQRDIPLAGRLSLERRALQGQITGLRLSDCNPTDFRNVDAAPIEFDSLRDSERLTCAAFSLEFGKARSFLKEVLERPLAIAESLLQQLRVELFQPLKTGLVFQFGQFNRERGPGDGFAGLFGGLLSTSKRPVEDEASCARKTGKRRCLPGGRINSEPVDLSFRHSISSALQDDVFAKSRSWTGIRERSGATRCFAPRQIHPPLEAE